MRRTILILCAILALNISTPIPRAHAQSAGCTILGNTASSAAAHEIDLLRHNVRKPKSVTGFVCLNIGMSIFTMSADAIVESALDAILAELVALICNALTDYWDEILAALNCTLDIGLGLGIPNIGFGALCHFDVNAGGGYNAAIHLGGGIGLDGGGFYITAEVKDVTPYGR